MSCPWAFFGSRFFIILAIPALETGIDESVLVVFILSIAGISFAFSIKGNCLAKKIVKKLSFVPKV